jgi:hypothetical protein
MSFVIDNIDAVVTLATGLWASLVGWYHPAINDPVMFDDAENVPKLERLIGPLIILFAALEFAVKQS